MTALKVLGRLLRPAEREFVSSADIAIIYAGLGERDQVFKWLEKATGKIPFGRLH